MSKPQISHDVEESPATQLGIDTITPAVFDRMLDVLGEQNLVLTVIGQSGIGKTAIPQQVAARRGVPYAQIHMPTAAPESFQLPSLPKDGTPFFDQKIPRTFQPLLEYVKEEKKKHKDGKIPAGRKAILALEELNRAPDKSTTRSAFVLMGDRMIGDVHLDDGIQIVATMNPSGQSFSVNEFEKDPAMRRRSLLLYLTADYADFMRYAEASKFHAEVIGYLRAHVSHFYDETAAKAGKVFACPATWESVSRACHALATSGEALTGAVARAAYSGIVGTATATTFAEYVKDRTTTVSPDDVLYRYGSPFDIRSRVKQLIAEERIDRMSDLVTGLVVRIVTLPKADQDPSKFAHNLAQFLCDIPPDISMSFMTIGSDHAKRGGPATIEWFSQKLNGALVEIPAFKAMIKTFSAAVRKGDAEAKAAGVK